MGPARQSNLRLSRRFFNKLKKSSGALLQRTFSPQKDYENLWESLSELLEKLSEVVAL